MLFLAKRMTLRGPPLHMAHPEEKKLFNDYLRDHSKPTAKTWDDLAAVFKEKANYTTVFPKLPDVYAKFALQ